MEPAGSLEGVVAEFSARVAELREATLLRVDGARPGSRRRAAAPGSRRRCLQNLHLGPSCSLRPRADTTRQLYAHDLEAIEGTLRALELKLRDIKAFARREREAIPQAEAVIAACKARGRARGRAGSAASGRGASWGGEGSGAWWAACFADAFVGSRISPTKLLVRDGGCTPHCVEYKPAASLPSSLLAVQLQRAHLQHISNHLPAFLPSLESPQPGAAAGLAAGGGGGGGAAGAGALEKENLREAGNAGPAAGGPRKKVAKRWVGG